MNIIKSIFATSAVILVVGCQGTIDTKNEGNGTIAQFESAVRGTTGAVNRTAPDFNNINTCPEGKQRTNHTAGGGGNANIATTEQGTGFVVDYTFGNGHKCK